MGAKLAVSVCPIKCNISALLYFVRVTYQPFYPYPPRYVTGTEAIKHSDSFQIQKYLFHFKATGPLQVDFLIDIK